MTHTNPKTRASALMRRVGLLLCAALVACTGLTLGENDAGQDTFLELGAIAVDHETDTVFVLRKGVAETGETLKTLWAVPAKGEPMSIGTLDGQGDVRVLFPASGVLVMAEQNGKEFLTLLDRKTLEVKKTATHKARYHGTRISPSRRWVAVGDNANKELPIVVIDTNDLSARRLPAPSDWKEASWATGSDLLVVLASWRHEGRQANSGDLSDWHKRWRESRVMVWSMETLVQHQFAEATDGFWAHRLIDVPLPDHAPDLLFSFSWVGVSPDDATVVVPLVNKAGAEPQHELVLLSTLDASIRKVPNAKGPVGFTPDGSAIVSYRDADHDGDGKLDSQDLLAVDVDTLATEQLVTPVEGLINFFITAHGHFVVVASWTGNSTLSLVDLDAKKVVDLGGPKLDLHEVVAHGSDLWVCDDGLFRLQVGDAKLDTVPLPFVPVHINRLPGLGQLVTGDKVGEELVYIAPDTGKILREVTLPAPQ